MTADFSLHFGSPTTISVRPFTLISFSSVRVPNFDKLFSILEFVEVEKGVGMAIVEAAVLLLAAASADGVVLLRVQRYSLFRSVLVTHDIVNPRMKHDGRHSGQFPQGFAR